MKKVWIRLVAIVFFFLTLSVVPALAYDQPSVNLGFTSFVDGAPPSGPGFYFQEYLQYYTANRLEDAPAPVSNPKLDAWISLNQLVYQSDQELFWGGKWGINLMLPIVNFDTRISPLTDNGGGFGDLLIGPFLQWDPIMGKNGPIFMHRIELSVILPTGRYSANEALNPGANFFSFNPYWAGTLFITPKLTVSTRLHYLWNAKNTDPYDPMGAGIKDTQAGQAVHANFAASYEVIEKKLRLGINGYALKQISSSEVDGQDVSGKEQVFAIGPGALFSFSKDTHLFFNAYFETGAQYRPEGERITLRLVHHF